MAEKKKGSGKRRTGNLVAKKPHAGAARAKQGDRGRRAARTSAPKQIAGPASAKAHARAAARPLKAQTAPAGKTPPSQRGPDAGGAAKPPKAVEAFCPRCKSETPHTIASMMGEKIRRVRCSSCGTEHNFHRSQTLKMRSVRTEAAAPAKRRREEQRAHSHERMFEEQMLGRDPGLAKTYDLRDKYYQEDLINHPIFGLGLVTRIKEDGKIDVMFKDGNRTLAHNRFVPPAPPPKRGGVR